MDLMHKYSRDIIDRCISMRVGTLVIGHNKGQKQSIELGGITNQNFVFIPFYKLIKMIKYKAEEVGILVIEQEESYTSKCSFPDSEEVKKHSAYLGKRISRGLFRTFKGMLINADVNGVYNIIRKAFPKIKFLVDGIEGVRLHPVRVNPLG
jgi:IS605 OrfB family transposase